MRLQITSSLFFFFQELSENPFIWKIGYSTNAHWSKHLFLRTIHNSTKWLFNIQESLPNPPLPKFTNPQLLQLTFQPILINTTSWKTCQTRSPPNLINIPLSPFPLGNMLLTLGEESDLHKSKQQIQLCFITFNRLSRW